MSETVAERLEARRQRALQADGPAAPTPGPTPTSGNTEGPRRPDNVQDILDALTELETEPNASPEERAGYAALAAQVRQGVLPEGLEDKGNSFGGFLRGVAGGVLGDVGGTLDFISQARYGASEWNSALRDPVRVLDLPASLGRIAEGVDVAGAAGSVAGLAGARTGIFGLGATGDGIENTLRDLLPESVGSNPYTVDDFVPLDSEAGNLFDLPSINQTVSAVTSLPGMAGLPVGSIDNVPLPFGFDDYRLGINPVKLLKFAIDVGTDPTSYVGGPAISTIAREGAEGVAARGVRQWVRRGDEYVLEAVEGARGGRLAASRQSREQAGLTLLDNYQALPTPKQEAISEVTLNRALQSVDEGGLRALVSDAVREVDGLSLKILVELGVDPGLVFGNQVFGTGVVSVLGLIRTGKVGQSGLGKIPELAGTVGRMLRSRTADQKEIRRRLADGSLSHLEHISEKSLRKDIGERAAAAMSNGSNRQVAIREFSSVLRDVSEPDALRSVDKDIIQMSGDLNFAEDVVGEAGKETFSDFINSFADHFDDTIMANIDNQAMGRYLDNVDVPEGHRNLAGWVLNGLKDLEESYFRNANSAGDFTPAQGSLTPRQILDGSPELVELSRTLRAFNHLVAGQAVFKGYAETGQSRLADAFFQASRNPDEVMKSWGADLSNWSQPLPPVAALPGAAAPEESLTKLIESFGNGFTAGGRRIPWQWQAAVLEPFHPLSRAALNAGNTENLVAELWAITDLMTAHQNGFNTFLSNARKGYSNIDFELDGSLIRKTVNNQFTALDAEQMTYRETTPRARNRALRLAEKDPEGFDEELTRVIYNGWFNPGWRSLYGKTVDTPGNMLFEKTGPIDTPWNMFSPDDRAVLGVAFEQEAIELEKLLKGLTPAQRFDADLLPISRIDEHMSVFQSWIDDWQISAQENFAAYNQAGMPVPAQEFARNLDAYYHNAMLRVKLFGGETWDNLADDAIPTIGDSGPGFAPEVRELMGEAIDKGEFFGMTEDAAALMARQAASLHYKRTGQMMTSLGGDYAVDATGDRMAQAVVDNALMLSSLGRARGGELQKPLDWLAKMNRTFKSNATASPGFSVNNAKGAVLLNHVKAKIPMRGVGSYDEFGDIAAWAYAAMNDELSNSALPKGGSPLWDLDNLAMLGDEYADAAARLKKLGNIQDDVRALADSGVITATGSTGSALDQATEQSEVSLGRGLAAISRGADRLGAASEQAVVPLTQGLTSGRLPRYNRASFARANVESATRSTNEGYLRGAMWWSGVRREGLSREASLQRVADTHHNYWDQTQGGQLMDELMPFWLFRSRNTMLTLEMIASTPGMANQLQMLEDMNGLADPYGIGAQDRPYTVGGFGTLGGMDLYGVVGDPRVDGLKGPKSLLDLVAGGMDADSQADFVLSEFIGNLSPLIRGASQQAFRVSTGFGESRFDDRGDLVQFEDGLIPRFVEGLGWSDEKISAVTGMMGLDTPLTDLFALTSNIEVQDGRVFITENGENFLTDLLPLLGRVDSAFASSLRGQARPNSTMTEEQLRAAAERKSFNAIMGFFGIPVIGISEDQRMRVAENFARLAQQRLSRYSDIEDADYGELLNEAIRMTIEDVEPAWRPGG